MILDPILAIFDPIFAILDPIFAILDPILAIFRVLGVLGGISGIDVFFCGSLCHAQNGPFYLKISKF